VSGKVGIICGGGAFPAAVAEAVRRRGGEVLLLPIRGFAEAEIVERYPHEWIALIQLSRLLRVLERHGVREVTFVGTVHRPRLRDTRIDWAALAWLPRYLAAQRRGDNHLLSFIASGFESLGIGVRGAHEVAPEILVPAGVLGSRRPAPEALHDIRLARDAIRALGPLDVGQAAVAAGGRVIAIEAAEGTAAMLARVAALRAQGRLHGSARGGVLVKAPKPGQDRRMDLPAIGVDTIEQAAAAGLAGIAVEAGGSIVADANALVQAADRAGLFVLGFDAANEAQL
jgi:hypothetical protein